MNSLRFSTRPHCASFFNHSLQLAHSRRAPTPTMQSDMCFQVLRPPTKHEIERQLLKEKAIREKLKGLIAQRECIARKALDDRKETVHVLESMKDRYVILLRQRKMISRAIHRRADEMRSLKKVISKNRMVLQG